MTCDMLLYKKDAYVFRQIQRIGTQSSKRRYQGDASEDETNHAADNAKVCAIGQIVERLTVGFPPSAKADVRKTDTSPNEEVGEI
ncbi:MAG: hypothetical protein L6R35_000448 [Caloplaca aegaea]|nr:MAG: hypothetical protein L6R35_000448 [Caloplaca aegaea]